MALDLHNNNIATPVLWLGDDIHKEFVKKNFKDCDLVYMNEAVHYPWRSESINFAFKDDGFFQSFNYLRAIEICNKLLDRLDYSGQLTRLDREIYIKYSALRAVHKVKQLNPDFLLTAEAPHSYVQYMMYEVMRYYSIPLLQSITWPMFPLIMMQDASTRKLISVTQQSSESNKLKYKESIRNIIFKISSALNHDTFMPTGDIKLRKNNLQTKFNKKKINEIGRFWLRSWKHRMNKEYNPVNPQLSNIFSILIRRKMRRDSLISEHKKNTKYINLDLDYVYFALHNEPERTTTPDGENFHDQFIALITLRSILPINIKIYVKEHMSQFIKDRGIVGRSPLFYKAIGEIHGVELTDSSVDYVQLIKNSLFVATITGTVGLEAAAMGRTALVFGNAWYCGVENIIKWNDELTFEDITNRPVASWERVADSLVEMIDKYTVLGYRNQYIAGVSETNKSKCFEKEERQGLMWFVMQFISEYVESKNESIS